MKRSHGARIDELADSNEPAMKMQKSEEEKVFIGIDDVGVAACHVYQFYPYKTQNSKRIRFLEVWGFESDIEMC